jgi:hypothetical protein
VADRPLATQRAKGLRALAVRSKPKFDVGQVDVINRKGALVHWLIVVKRSGTPLRFHGRLDVWN